MNVELRYGRSTVADSASSAITVPAIGLELRVRLSREASGGQLTVIETSNAPGFGPPLHRHAETEVFRVLSGRYLYEVDGSRFVAETGDVVHVPGGTPHAFINIGDVSASQLVMILPGLDAAAFFSELGDVMQGVAPDREALASFANRWGVEFLGPPLQEPSNLLAATPVRAPR
jgi:quercetin dioxygenase-like cupin family protein